jgi:hypothetical protein
LLGEKSDSVQGSHRGNGAGMHEEGKRKQHGKPRVVAVSGCQLEAREGQARLCGVADRPVVPRRPGNAGGGKGPWFKVSVRSGESREIGDEPTTSR